MVYLANWGVKPTLILWYKVQISRRWFLKRFGENLGFQGRFKNFAKEIIRKFGNHLQFSLFIYSVLFCGRGGEGFGFPLPICNRYLKSWLICIFQLWMSPWFENLKNLLSKAFLDFILTFLRLLIYQNAHFFNDSDEFQILRICWSNISMQEVMRLPRLDF